MLETADGQGLGKNHPDEEIHVLQENLLEPTQHDSIAIAQSLATKVAGAMNSCVVLNRRA